MSGAAWPFLVGRGASAAIPSTVLLPLTADGWIFREGGLPWRMKGASQFKLLDRFVRGEDIDPVLEAYAGFNTLRVWTYTPVKDWGSSAWGWPSIEATIEFVEYLAARGFRTYLGLLTDDDPANLAHAQEFARSLPPLPSLLLEGGNEPITHKTIDTAALRPVLDATGLLYTSGDYEDSARWFGLMYDCHTQRSHDWPRRAHDLYEFYNGDGPDKVTVPHHVPPFAGEPIRPDQATPKPGAPRDEFGLPVADARAYYGACSLMGAGGIVHTETGKLGLPPEEYELNWMEAALEGLEAFPADAPGGAYRRIVEPGNEHGGPTETSRTYVVGDYAVRCQQVGTEFPETGWLSLDSDGVLWARR